MKRNFSQLSQVSQTSSNRRRPALTLRGQNQRNQTSLQRQSQSQREDRLEYLRNFNTLRRQSETEEQRTDRLNDQLERTISNRESENAEQREARMANDRERHRLQYELELEENTAAALHNPVPVDGIHLSGFHDRNQALVETSVERYDCGINDQICQHCQARNFAGERLLTKDFSICCSRGKIMVDEYKPAPDWLQKLYCASNDNELAEMIVFRTSNF